MYLWCVFLLCMLVALLLEIQVPIPMMGGWGHLPWIHALVVYYALHQKLPMAFAAAVLGGLCVDAYTVGQPGIAILLYGLVVYLADRFRRQIISDALITAVVFGMFANLGFYLLRLGVIWTEGYRGLSVSRVLVQSGFSLASAAVITPFVGFLMRAIHRGLDLMSAEEGPHVNT